MPLVSVIVPCYNEASTITDLLEAIAIQTWPKDSLEVIIVDGHSDDGTPQRIQDWAAQRRDVDVRVIDNPRRIIPAALNLALAAARGEIIVRLDAHSAPQPDYVARCVDLLQAGQGDVVGGRWEIRPGGKTWIARAIAAAAGHPLGAGDARYRYSETPGVVDTVPFGAFYRHLTDKIGRFDESLLTNEDYEFNARVRKAGGVIWFDPSIRAAYQARAHLGALFRQYTRYGFWKWRMLRRHPGTLRWRQALPFLFVLGLLGFPLAWALFSLPPWLGWLYIGVVAFYLLVLLGAGLALARRRKDAWLIVGFPLAVMTMHLAWGLGFWASLVATSLHGFVRPLHIEDDYKRMS